MEDIDTEQGSCKAISAKERPRANILPTNEKSLKESVFHKLCIKAGNRTGQKGLDSD